MDDTTPPRLFRTVTSAAVQYNMDTVEYLMKQEDERRVVARQQQLSGWDRDEFRRELIGALIIRGDAQAAINLRPTKTQSTILLEIK